MSYNMVLCSLFVLVVDVRVTWEDDRVIRMVGQISYNMVLCGSFVLIVNVGVSWEDDGVIGVVGQKM